MAFLKEKDREYVGNLFEGMQNKVKIIFFTQEIECQYCSETHQIVSELESLSEKLDLQVFNFQTEKDKAKQYGVDKIPAIILEGKKKSHVRYFGIPSGYEFASLIEDIVDVSKSDSGLTADSRTFLATINRPLHLQVFVTPTCPHCPKVVRLAHKVAIENDNITADMVEATEFPHLAMRYNVRGVPKTIIADKMELDGAVPENIFVEKIVEVFKSVDNH